MKDKNNLKKKLKVIQKAFEAYSKNKPIVEEIPPDWFCRKDWQIANKVSECHAVRQINSLIRSNKVDKKSFHKITEAGCCRLIPHYRLKD